MNFLPTPSAKTTSLVAILGASTLLVACATEEASEDTAASTTTASAQETTTSEQVSTVVSTTEQVSTTTVTEAEQQDAQQSCEEVANPLPATGVAAAFESESFYHFSFDEDAFDACAPISWTILHGSLGTEDSPGATAGSTAEAVVFFASGELVEQQPALVPTVDAVTATSDEVVAASYWVDNGPRAAGDQELLTSWYVVNADGVVTTEDSLVDRPEIQYLDLESL